MKRAVALFITVLILLFGICTVYAAPSSINAGETGNVTDLIVVKKPESKNSATLKKTYGITGTGRNGVTVTYYKFNGMVYNSIKNASGAMSQTKIGSAGVFYKQVNLSEGRNKYAVRADSANGTYQIEYFDINVLDQQVINNINVFSSGIQTLYNGWMN